LRIEEVIGQWIAEGRDQTGMSQAELGEQLEKLLGKSWPRQAVSAAEKGRRAFTAAELVAFAIALGCNVEDLLQPRTSTVTLANGPPVESRHLRTSAATGTDLEDCVTSMQRLRETWVDLRNKSRVMDLKVGVAYKDLTAALRGRGIARKDES